MMNKNIRYVAFLRGINVGGHALVKMADLKKAFEEMGFRNVRTLLASGNVLFETGQMDRKTIAGKIGSGLKLLLKKDVGVALRGLDDLEKIRLSEPFRGIEATPSMRLYVTFLAEKPRLRAISIPYATPRGELRILGATPTEVFSVLDLSKGKGTPEAMAIIEKEFGANVTTRNWNTVLKALR
jgi:uncharacterized protein (DUF1697 family)